MKKVFHYLFLIFWFLIQEDIAILLLHQVQQTKEIVIFFAQFFLMLLTLLFVLGLKHFKIDNLFELNKIEYGILSLPPFLSIILLLYKMPLPLSRVLIFDSYLLNKTLL